MFDTIYRHQKANQTDGPRRGQDRPSFNLLLEGGKHRVGASFGMEAAHDEAVALGQSACHKVESVAHGRG